MSEAAPSGHWAPLLPAAMVGTDRQALPAPAVGTEDWFAGHWPGPIGELLCQVAGSGRDPATNLLRMSAVISTCALAGAGGIASSTPQPAAAEDSLPAPADGQLLELLAWVFGDGPGRLQQQVCLALAQAGLRLPHALLPQVLDLGRRSVALRPAILPVLGERGLWLAAQNEDWAYAAGVSAPVSDEAHWEEGSFEQRREFLRLERVRDPKNAGDRLAKSLGELSAKERAELAGVLVESLSLEDEALLDKLRGDRSREVRQAALALLLRLPSSALIGRAKTRMEALLKVERGLLRKKWAIDAPTSPASDWKDDGIEVARPKHESLGERGWWLYQLVRQVPLEWWTEHLDMKPAELCQWARSTEWAEAVLRGWRDVLFATPEPEWCEAFIDNWPAKVLRDDPAPVIALLPWRRRERYWENRLKTGAAPMDVLLAQMLAACPAGETLSAGLSNTLADLLHRLAQTKKLADDYSLRNVLPELCCTLEIDSLDRLAQLPRHDEETPSFARAMRDVAQVIATRLALLSALPTRTP